MTAYVKLPFMVNDLVVYPESPGRARVIDVDCRYELETTPDSCTCCTFRFGSYRKQGFECKHIKAFKKVLEGGVSPDFNA